MFFPDNISLLLQGCYIFVDNDFLNYIFKVEEIFEEFFKMYPSDFVEYDPFTEFEFLRDIFVPKEREKREEFLSLPIFVPTSNHQTLFKKASENALILSKIYAINKKNADTVDLFLAGRVMMFDSSVHLIITGNKKHFPDCIWDLVTSFTFYNENEERFITFSVLRFNKQKFDENFDLLLKL